jgi:glyoxylate utilization-related uncharacterized protein
MELSERCIAQLEQEGFVHIYEWQEGPNDRFSDRVHTMPTALYISEGSVEITLQGITKTLRTGERLDIPEGIPYSTVAGPSGCQYVAGEHIA